MGQTFSSADSDLDAYLVTQFSIDIEQAIQQAILAQNAQTPYQKTQASLRAITSFYFQNQQENQAERNYAAELASILVEIKHFKQLTKDDIVRSFERESADLVWPQIEPIIKSLAMPKANQLLNAQQIMALNSPLDQINCVLICSQLTEQTCYLRLINAHLTRFPEEVFYLNSGSWHHLNCVNLSQNHLMHLNIMLRHSSETWIVNENVLHALDVDYFETRSSSDSYPTIRQLNLSANHNILRHVSLGRSRLVHIELSDNQLQSFKVESWWDGFLSHLDLSHNQLSSLTLPEDYQQADKVQFLLEGNPVDEQTLLRIKERQAHAKRASKALLTQFDQWQINSRDDSGDSDILSLSDSSDENPSFATKSNQPVDKMSIQ